MSGNGDTMCTQDDLLFSQINATHSTSVDPGFKNMKAPLDFTFASFEAAFADKA